MENQTAPSNYFVWFFLLLLAWSPIPLGSNRPWAWAILNSGIFVAAGYWLWGYALGRHQLTPAFRKAWFVSILLLLWLLFGLVQWIPLPIEWVRLVSPNAAENYASAAKLTGGYASYISIDSHASLGYFVRSIALALTFWLTLLLLSRHRSINWLAYTLVVSGVFQAVYATVDMFSNHLPSASGTFMNRNHFANYLGLCVSVGIGLIISQLVGDKAPTNWIHKFREILRLLLSAKAIVRLCLVIMVIGIVLSRSRMGNTALFSSLLIAGIISLAFSRRATRSMVVLVTSLIIIDILIVGTWFGVEQVKQRIEETTFASERRDEVDLYTLDLIKDYRLTGTGLGSFYIAFPRYRQGDVENYYEHTENDYLQITAESGIIGIALFGAVVFCSYGAAMLAHFRRRDPLMRGISFSAIMGITAILIHALVEFNLQIPANAMLLMVLLAFCWISLGFESQSLSKRRHSPSAKISGSSLDN